MSTLGRILSSHFGNHQALSPSSAITDGISTIRTTNASKKTAAANAKPMDLMNESGSAMNAANTEIMMTAAEVTTRAPYLKPLTTASLAAAPCTNSSRMRETRNTW